MYEGVETPCSCHLKRPHNSSEPALHVESQRPANHTRTSRDASRCPSTSNSHQAFRKLPGAQSILRFQVLHCLSSKTPSQLPRSLVPGHSPQTCGSVLTLAWVPHNSVARPALSPSLGPTLCPQCPAQAQPGPWWRKRGRPPWTPHLGILTEVAPGGPRSPGRPCHSAGTCTHACPMHTASVSRSCWELTRHLLLPGQ